MGSSSPSGWLCLGPSMPEACGAQPEGPEAPKHLETPRWTDLLPGRQFLAVGGGEGVVKSKQVSPRSPQGRAGPSLARQSLSACALHWRWAPCPILGLIALAPVVFLKDNGVARNLPRPPAGYDQEIWL